MNPLCGRRKRLYSELAHELMPSFLWSLPIEMEFVLFSLSNPLVRTSRVVVSCAEDSSSLLC